MGNFVDQYSDKPDGQAMEVVAVDEAFKKKYPAIYDFVVTGVVGKKVRRTSTVTLFAEAGFFKLCLNDRQRGCTLWRTGENVLGGIESLERALKDGTADWRPNATGSYGPRKA